MSGPHGRSNSKSRFASSVNGNHSDQTPQVKAGVNPLYGSEIKAGSGIQSLDASGTEDEGTASTRPEGTRGQGPSSRTIIISSRGSSPLSSTMTTSTAQSAATSNAGRHLSSGKVTNITRVSGGSGSTCSITSRSGAMDEKVSRSESTRTEPPVLVPALMAPVPPPPRKRRLEKAPDVECGEVEAEVVQEAPDKTLMEMLQSYLNKQDVYTRVMLVMILMVLAGGVFGAYGVLLVYAIRDHNLKYIVLCSLFTAVFLSVLWKYCFSGDQRLQDQSAIAQDIATLYASIPDHTALRGVSAKGRAQFTSFKYEKSEMMFTAVTDDGVSLGSERGSELMMDGADPACPLCNIAYIEGAELCLLPCLHVFHGSCINRWCDSHIVCPLCKRHLEAPEPIHTLTAAHLDSAQSEPGRNSGTNRSGTWQNMLGSSQPGPASGHGSDRGLGGTRSDDGMWNDRVLNAAQRQLSGRAHNRVTSFSSGSRRSSVNGGRGRGGGPGNGRSASVRHGTPARGVQRQRSSSFTTASDRSRGGSGRVAYGTRATRGGVSGRAGEGSPRSRSDLGFGSKEAEQVRASTDAILSRHAARHAWNSAKGVAKVSAEEGTGIKAETGNSTTSTATPASEQMPNRKPAVVTVTSKRASGRGVRSQGQGPAVITVRKVKPAAGKGTAKFGGPGGQRNSTSRDSGRSGGESDIDTSARKLFTSRRIDSDNEAHSSSEMRKLSYGPRKPRVSRASHRRTPSTGSTSAEESNQARRPRRRATYAPDSSSGGGADAAATVSTKETTSRLSRRSTDRTCKIGMRSDASGNSSGGESSSDGRMRVARRRISKSTAANRRSSRSGPNGTPPKAVPVTKGTPAPPMAAARAASWNSVAPAPIDTCASGETEPPSANKPASSEAQTNLPDMSDTGSTAGRGLSLRLQMAAGNVDLFGLGSAAHVANTSEGDGPVGVAKGKSLASKVFGPSGAGRLSSGRLFGSGTARIGKVGGCGTDSEDERTMEFSSEGNRKSRVTRTGSVQELIQTYEKTRSNSDERSVSDEHLGLSVSDSGSKRGSRTFRRRRESRSGSAGNLMELLRAGCDQQEPINRPKLSYTQVRHSRTHTPTDMPIELPLDDTIPTVNPDGEDWGTEEPYMRPKLSYGGGLGSNRKPGLNPQDFSTEGAVSSRASSIGEGR